MLHSGHLNNYINIIHERIAVKDCQSTFNVLLESDCSGNIFVKCLQTLMIEVFKLKENLNPPFMKENFCERSVFYSLSSKNEPLLLRVRRVRYGTKTIIGRERRLWVALPHQIRNKKSINELKYHIKNWNRAVCTCRLCLIFVPQLGFLK